MLFTDLTILEFILNFYSKPGNQYFQRRSLTVSRMEYLFREVQRAFKSKEIFFYLQDH